MEKYIVIDTETGGVDPFKHSLLQIGGVLWEPGDEPRPLFNTFVNEGHHDFCAEDEALAINKIDVKMVERFGLSPQDTITLIRQAIRTRLGEEPPRLIVVGHNVNFDFMFLRRLYRLAGDNIATDFSHRTLDTASVMRFLQIAGMAKFEKIDSDALFKFCGSEPSEEERHTALGDALATARALNYLVTQAKEDGFLSFLPEKL